MTGFSYTFPEFVSSESNVAALRKGVPAERVIGYLKRALGCDYHLFPKQTIQGLYTGQVKIGPDGVNETYTILFSERTLPFPMKDALDCKVEVVCVIPKNPNLKLAPEKVSELKSGLEALAY